MKVVICGPNLRDQSKGQFHVHRAGCADLMRGRGREPEYMYGWDVEVHTRRELAEAIYDDHMAENPDKAEDTEYWLEEVHVFPCVGELR